MPDTAQNLWMQLGQPDYIKNRAVEFFENPQSVDLPAGQPIGQSAPPISPANNVCRYAPARRRLQVRIRTARRS